MRVNGRGATDPLQPNDTPSGREANRRTEIVISGIATAGVAP